MQNLLQLYFAILFWLIPGLILANLQFSLQTKTRTQKISQKISNISIVTTHGSTIEIDLNGGNGGHGGNDGNEAILLV